MTLVLARTVYGRSSSLKLSNPYLSAIADSRPCRGGLQQEFTGRRRVLCRTGAGKRFTCTRPRYCTRRECHPAAEFFFFFFIVRSVTKPSNAPRVYPSRRQYRVLASTVRRWRTEIQLYVLTRDRYKPICYSFDVSRA